MSGQILAAVLLAVFVAGVNVGLFVASLAAAADRKAKRGADEAHETAVVTELHRRWPGSHAS